MIGKNEEIKKKQESEFVHKSSPYVDDKLTIKEPYMIQEEQKEEEKDGQELQKQSELVGLRDRVIMNMPDIYQEPGYAPFVHEKKPIAPEVIKALDPIMAWTTLRQNTSLPLKNAAIELLEAKNVEDSAAALAKTVECALTYLERNRGYVWFNFFNHGKDRKDAVKDFLNSVAVFMKNAEPEYLKALDNSSTNMVSQGKVYDSLIVFSDNVKNELGQKTTSKMILPDYESEIESRNAAIEEEERTENARRREIVEAAAEEIRKEKRAREEEAIREEERALQAKKAEEERARKAKEAEKERQEYVSMIKNSLQSDREKKKSERKAENDYYKEKNDFLKIEEERRIRLADEEERARLIREKREKELFDTANKKGVGLHKWYLKREVEEAEEWASTKRRLELEMRASTARDRAGHFLDEQEKRDQSHLKRIFENGKLLDEIDRLREEYLALDQKASAGADLIRIGDNCRLLIERVVDVDRSILTIVPTEQLISVTENLRDYIDDPAGMQEYMKGKLKQIEKNLDSDEYLDGRLEFFTGKEAPAGEASARHMREYAITALAKVSYDLSGFNGYEYSEVDFKDYGNLELAELAKLAFEYKTLKPDSDKLRDMAELREISLELIESITGNSNPALETFPSKRIYELAGKLLTQLHDRPKSALTVSSTIENFYKTYTLEDLKKRIEWYRSDAKEGDKKGVRDMKEYAICALLKYKGGDVSIEELNNLPGETLRDMVYQLEEDNTEVKTQSDPMEGVRNLTAQMEAQKARLDVAEKSIKRINEEFCEALSQKKNEHITNQKKKGFIVSLMGGKKEEEERHQKDINELNDKYKFILDEKYEEVKKLSKDIEELKHDIELQKVIAKEESSLPQEKKSRLRYNIDETKRHELDRGYYESFAGKQKKHTYGRKMFEIDRWRFGYVDTITFEKSENKQTEWSKVGKVTLSMVSELLSGEAITDKKGRVLSGTERTTEILSRRADLICLMCEAKSSKKPGPERELLSSCIKEERGLILAVMGVVNGIVDKINEKQNGAPLTAEGLRALLSDPEISKLLAKTDEDIDKAVTESSRMISDSLELVTDNLLTGTAEEITPLGEEKRDISKTEESNKKLNRIRDEAYDTTAGQGKFLNLVIRGYFDHAAPEQKRFMMSQLIRDMKPGRGFMDGHKRGGVVFSSIVKGAGPILQKLIQGIPEELLSSDLRPILSVVKSDLRHIPVDYVIKRLNEIAADSGGLIKSITPRSYLGAASVAETYLCEVEYTDGRKKEKVVIKLLRPDAKERMEREVPFIEDCARKADKNGVMANVFGAQLSKIKEEFDFTNEAANMELGKVYDYKNPDTGTCVSSVKLNSSIKPGKDYLAMEPAYGTTLDRYFTEIKEASNKAEREFSVIGKDGKREFQINMDNIEKIPEVRAELVTKWNESMMVHQHMERLVKLWIENAFFEKKSLFHHGDLHAGNIMVEEDGATVLDFGNATVISKEMQGPMLRVMAAACFGYSKGFMLALDDLLKLDKENDFNSLPGKEKKLLMDKIRQTVEPIFKLGDERNTGQRIFASFIKLQELGLKLPKDLLNFIQCEQRLENTVDEMNKRLQSMRDTIRRIDYSHHSLNIKGVTLDARFMVQNVQANNSNNDFDASPELCIKECTNMFRTLKEEDLTKAFSLLEEDEDYNGIDFEVEFFSYYSSMIRLMNPEKKNGEKARKLLPKIPAMLKGGKKKDYLEIIAVFRNTLQMFGGFQYIDGLMKKGFEKNDEAAMEKLKDILGNSLPMMAQVSKDWISYKKLIGKKSDKKAPLEKNLKENIMALYKKSELDIFRLRTLRGYICPEEEMELTADNYDAIMNTIKENQIIVKRALDYYLFEDEDLESVFFDFWSAQEAMLRAHCLGKGDPVKTKEEYEKKRDEVLRGYKATSYDLLKRKWKGYEEDLPDGYLSTFVNLFYDMFQKHKPDVIAALGTDVLHYMTM